MDHRQLELKFKVSVEGLRTAEEYPLGHKEAISYEAINRYDEISDTTHLLTITVQVTREPGADMVEFLRKKIQKLLSPMACTITRI